MASPCRLVRIVLHALRLAIAPNRRTLPFRGEKSAVLRETRNMVHELGYNCKGYPKAIVLLILVRRCANYR